MTGTASVIYENEPAVDSVLNDFDLFSAWLFGNINTDCIVREVTESGCSLQVPASHEMRMESVNLIMMDPDNRNRVQAVIVAEQRWENPVSASHKVAGFKFDRSCDAGDIEKLIALQHGREFSEIQCRILQRK